MRKHIILFYLIILSASCFAQTVTKTVGIVYTAGAPAHAPAAKVGSQVAIDTATWEWYEYNGSAWIASGDRIQTISGCSAPNYTPTKYQSRLVINACSAGQGGPELYYYTGSAWLQINEGTTYTAGAGIDISGSVISVTPDMLNIATLGAVGNGSTDNTTIIRAALLQSKIIYVPPGAFVCDSIVVPEGRTILGAGENSILLFKSGSTGRFVDCRNGNVTLQNIVISGGESSATYASTTTASNRIGVYLKGDNNDTKILNAWIRGFNAAGISGNGASSNRERSPTVSGCSILNCFIGINTNQGAAAGCEYLRIENCNIGGCRIGVDVNSGNCLISGNTISDNGYGLMVKSGGTGGNAGHGTISGNLINHSTVTGIVFLSTPFGYSITGNNIFFGGLDITGDGVMISNNVLGFTTGDSLMLRNGNNCTFSGNYVATSFSYVSSIGSAWLYANNRTVSGTFIDGLFNPVFNSSASYNTSTNTLSAPNIVSTATLKNNVAASSGITGYINTSNAAASTTQLNPGITLYQTGGGFPFGMDLGYSNSRYRNRIFTRGGDISLSKATTDFPTSQTDFYDIVTVRSDNDRVGIGTQSPTEKLEVIGNIKTSGNLIAAGLDITSAFTFSSRISAPDFRQTSNAGANLSNYFRTSNSAVSTTLLNPGIILYESGNNFAHGMDLGYSNSRYRTRIFTNNDISFAYAPGVVDEQSDFIDIMTIRGDVKTVGIGTQNPDASAILDVSSTTKGFLPPKMTTTQRNAISGPTAGLTVYCTDCTATDASTGVIQTYNGSTWKSHW